MLAPPAARLSFLALSPHLMLCLGGNYVLLPPSVEPSDPLNGQIVALSRPRGEDDLLRGAVDEGGNLGTSLLH